MLRQEDALSLLPFRDFERKEWFVWFKNRMDRHLEYTNFGKLISVEAQDRDGIMVEV